MDIVTLGAALALAKKIPGSSLERAIAAAERAEAAADTVAKYDDILAVIKVTDPATTMGDIQTVLADVNGSGDHVVFDVAGLNAGMYLCTIYIGAGYYRIADMVTGFVGTGFFAASDKLADVIKSGSQSSGKHYTMKWDMVNAQGERLNDAAAITADTTHFGHFGSVDEDYDNPFDSIYPWSERKLCNIDLDLYRALSAGDDLRDCVVAWEGDVNFSYQHAYGVWVYTPAFFGRSYVLGNYRYFDVTDENLQNNVAYKPTIQGRWQGVDVTLTIDGTAKTCNLPKVGVPISNVAMSTQHTWAKNWGGTLTDIYTVDASNLLYIVEYASMNAQNKIGSGVSDMYMQSTKHPAADVTGSTKVVVADLSAAQIALLKPGAVIDIGTSDGSKDVARRELVAYEAVGNGTELEFAEAVTCTTAHFVSIHGLANMADEEIGSHSGYIGANGKSHAYYRGEILYANRWQYVLGAYRHTGDGNIWICDEDTCDDYDALNTSVHHDTGLTLPTADGYIKTLGLCDGLSAPPFCTAIGGNASNPVGDYLYRPALTTGNTVLLLGGFASYGACCGPLCANWLNAASLSVWGCGSRPRLKNPS